MKIIVGTKEEYIESQLRLEVSFLESSRMSHTAGGSSCRKKSKVESIVLEREAARDRIEKAIDKYDLIFVDSDVQKLKLERQLEAEFWGELE